jgi:hypothetical protein
MKCTINGYKNISTPLPTMAVCWNSKRNAHQNVFEERKKKKSSNDEAHRECGKNLAQ